MKNLILVIKNINSQMYDVVVVNSSMGTVLETICTCKSYNNAELIATLIKNKI